MFSLFKRKKKVPESIASISIKKLNILDLDILVKGCKPFMSKEFLISPVSNIDEFINLLDKSIAVMTNVSESDLMTHYKIIHLEDKKIYYSDFINIKDYKNLHNYIKEFINKSILFLKSYEVLENKLDKTMEEERTLRVYRYLFSHICSISEQLENIVNNNL